MDQLLLYKYFKGDVSAEEKLTVKDWVMASKQNEQVFFQQRRLGAPGFFRGNPHRPA